MEKAKKFYDTVFGGIVFHDMDQNGNKYAIFPSKDPFNTGALVQGEYHKPSSDGICIYMDGGKNLNNILKHVEKAGGQIIMPKTYTGKNAGYIGVFLDSGGNKIGLQHM